MNDIHLKELIHKFRNAIVITVETSSYKAFNLPRWSELNSFPFGSCDIASNMLAKYLKSKGFEPKIIWCQNTLESYEKVKSHVWVEIEDSYIDITISQFPDYDHRRIYIGPSREKATMLGAIASEAKSQGNYEEREISLRTAINNGNELYKLIESIADKL